MFFLDGQPYTKPVFETYVPRKEYFRQFTEAGTDVFCFSTNLGPGFGTPTWVAPDQWDFRALDELAHRVLESNPRGLLLPRLYLTTPEWWIEAHPQECQVLAHGGKHYRQGIGHGRDGKVFPSLASRRWRADTAAGLQTVIRHIQESDYGAHVFGYMITGLMSEEWYHWSIHSGELSDSSPHAARAFRVWLGAKYRSVDALRCAWNNSSVDFDSADVPSQPARQAGRNERTFRDPATEMPVIDWYLFYNDLIPDTIDSFARAAKEACHHRNVVGTFYCYLFEFGGDPEFGHNAMAKLAQSPHLDFVAVTASYFDRELGHGADYARAPITSVDLHGILWYHDNDTVSFRYDEMNAGRQDRETVARYRRELGVTETPQHTIWQYRRGAGFVLGNGIYQAFFDLHGGYFDDPVLMAEVKRLNLLLAGAKDRDCSSVAEILVVSDETSCSYTTFESGMLQQTLQPAQAQLAKLGAPHDSILVDDLALADSNRYKFIIFLNCFHFADAQRQLIRRRVLGRNRTVLWCYAPGLFHGAQTSVDAMRELTGMRLALAAEPDRVQARISLNERGKRVAGIPHLSPGVVGHEHVWARLISVVDDSAVALGTLPGRSEVVLAMKSMRDWTSVYTLNPVLPASLLRALARREALKTSLAAAFPLLATAGAIATQPTEPARRPKVGIATFGFNTLSNADLAKELAAAGIGAVQLFLSQTDSNFWRYNQRSDVSSLTAERHNAVVLLEPFFRGFLASAKRTRLFLEEVDSPRLRALLDPANLLEVNDLEEMFGQLGHHIDCLHAKDRKLHVDRGVPAGQGDLDYRRFVTLAAERTPHAPLILEYVGPADYRQALAYLRQILRQTGLSES